MMSGQAEDTKEGTGHAASLSHYDSRSAHNSAALATNLISSKSRFTPKILDADLEGENRLQQHLLTPRLNSRRSYIPASSARASKRTRASHIDKRLPHCVHNDRSISPRTQSLTQRSVTAAAA